MQKDVFSAMPHKNIPNGPEIAKFDLNAAAYPNPTDGDLFVKIYVEENTDVSLSLYNTLGARIHYIQTNIPEGESILVFDLMKDLPRGFYNLMIESDSAYKIIKVVKER